MTIKPEYDAEAARQARLTAALRANLQKRKARDRQKPENPTANTSPAPGDDPESL